MKLLKFTEIDTLAFEATIELANGNVVFIEDDGRSGDFKYCSMTDGVKTPVVEKEFKAEISATGQSMFEFVMTLINEG
jgi:hypothetical protein